MARLLDYARTLRSKNAGAFLLTIDVVMKSPEAYQKIIDLGVLTPERVGKLYDLPTQTVSVIPYPQVHAIKVTMPRAHPSGDVSDSDVYGAQQHVPIMMMEVDG